MTTPSPALTPKKALKNKKKKTPILVRKVKRSRQLKVEKLQSDTEMTSSSNEELSAEQLVNNVLKNAGYLEVSEQTFDQLLDIASKGPSIGNNKDTEDLREKIIQLYTLLVSSPEFQLA